VAFRLLEEMSVKLFELSLKSRETSGKLSVKKIIYDFLKRETLFKK